MAIVSALIATVVLAGLGVALALLGLEESMLAGHDRASRALRLASESAAQLAIADLRRAGSWTALGALTGRFSDATLTPASPWDGAPLDLQAETASVQAEADAFASGARRRWHLLESGPLTRAAAGESSPFYLVVWVADDGADVDGDPDTESNGILTLRADALGPNGGRASTLVSVMRTPVVGGPDAIRVLTIRYPS